MAEIKKIENVEIDAEDIYFEPHERVEFAASAVEDMTQEDINALVPFLFACGDIKDTAMACAAEIRGGLDSDEERELLEELDITLHAEPPVLTTEQLIYLLSERMTLTENYTPAEVAVLGKSIELAIRRTANDFKSLRSLYRKGS